MKQCPRCGGQLKGRFCGKCGFDTEADAKVGSNSGKNYPQKFEAEQKTRQTDSGKNYPRKPAAERQSISARQQPIGKKKNRLVPILIGVCALLLALAVVLTAVLIPLLKERKAEANEQASIAEKTTQPKEGDPMDDPASAAEKTPQPKEGAPDDDFSLNIFGNRGGSLTLTTGGEMGTYYSFGSVLANQVSSTTDTRVTAVTSYGSKSNIEALIQNDAQLGIVQSDVAAYAYTGTRSFDLANTSFSAVAALYREHVQIVTLDPNTKTVADLKGKRVAIGVYGSGVYFTAIDVLGAYGIDADEDINPTYQNFMESAEDLNSGRIDAAFVVAGAPTASVYSLAVERQLYLLNFDDEHIRKLMDRCPYYTKGVIPRSVYNTPEDVTTVAVMAVVLARNDVSDTDVYNFLSGVFDHIPDVTAAHAKGSELDLAFAASFDGVPYHPAAEKFYQMKGLPMTRLTPTDVQATTGASVPLTDDPNALTAPTADMIAGAAEGKIIKSGVRMRQGPSTNTTIIATGLKSGTRVTVYAEDGDFYFVLMNDTKKYGYISKQFIKLLTALGDTSADNDQPEGTVLGTVTASTLSLREGPSATSPSLGMVVEGKKVYIFYQEDEYYYVLVAGTEWKGYLSAQFIEPEGDVPVKTP